MGEYADYFRFLGRSLAYLLLILFGYFLFFLNEGCGSDCRAGGYVIILILLIFLYFTRKKRKEKIIHFKTI